jgi:ribosomal protein L35AE/L33A
VIPNSQRRTGSYKKCTKMYNIHTYMCTHPGHVSAFVGVVTGVRFVVQVTRAHGSTGTVRAKFAKNLPPKAIVRFHSLVFVLILVVLHKLVVCFLVFHEQDGMCRPFLATASFCCPCTVHVALSCCVENDNLWLACSAVMLDSHRQEFD